MQDFCYTALPVSALEKVFPDTAPTPDVSPLSVLLGDLASFQIAITLSAPYGRWVTLRVSGTLAPYARLRAVKLMPSAYPCHPRSKDANYLRTTPGLYPDRLEALPPQTPLKICVDQWRALWIDIETDAQTPPGEHTLRITGTDENGAAAFDISRAITVIGAILPPHTLYHTEWLHADCLCDYYHITPHDERFLPLAAAFIRTAVRRGINTILTPLFTPPLDTAEGGSRTTMQLVDVTRKDGRYAFTFTRLKQWIDMCLEEGVQYIELSHLFSQWGAKYAPKITGYEAGEEKQFFGWDTPGTGPEYTAFLSAFLPQLHAALTAWGVADRCLYHVSDEPEMDHLAQCQAAYALVKRILPEARVVDAMSDLAIYQACGVDIPAVAVDRIGPFLAAGVRPLWAYYCTAQAVDVSNRFFAMPSARNRILGVQLYAHWVQGFLQWGYNFYNAQFSRRHIDPYRVTDADEAFPSGDAFLVYPGPDGQPEESIRMMVLAHAFGDIRAMTLLETLKGRDAVEALIAQGLQMPLTFTDYPQDAAYLLALREKVNRAIASATADITPA